MSADRDFEHFIDSVMEADFEYDDLVRVVGDYHKDGIDRFDAEKILNDFCGIRYRYTFLYIAITVIHAIARPKKDHKQSMKHLKRANVLLAEMIHQMERVNNAAKEGEQETTRTGEADEEGREDSEDKEA